MTSEELAQRLKCAKATAVEARHFEATKKQQQDAAMAKAKADEERVPAILDELLRTLEREPARPGQLVDVMDVGSYCGDWNFPDPGKLSGDARKIYDFLDAAAAQSGWYPHLARDYDMADNRYMMIKVRYGVPYDRPDTRYSGLVD